jgi:hypothetical protein
MTGDELGTKFLSEIQGIEPFKPLAAAIRRVLGINEPEIPVAPAPVQTFVPPEFPQIRVKFDSSGKELARSRVITSLDDLSLLSRENSEIFAWLRVPLAEKE